jgi:hypothetical protein
MMLAVALAGAAVPAEAQDSGSVGVTPFVALGSNGSAPVGAAITLPVTNAFDVETEVAYRRGEGRIHALDLNMSMVYRLPRIGSTTPYLAGGVGLREYGAPIVLPGAGYPVATQQLVTLTINAGGGIKVPVDDTWGMRTDARWFKSLGRHSSEHFRVAQGISFDVKKR